MAELRVLSPDCGGGALAAALTEEGACVVEGLLPTDRLRRLTDEIMPYVEATETGRDAFTGDRTTRTGALVARSAESRALVTDPLILGACDAFLKPFCDVYQLHLTQAIRIRPGQKAQPLHRDRLAWGGYLPAELEPQLNTIWALTDFTAANGATRVAPGSNRWSPERRAVAGEVCQAEMAAGSVLVYSGSVIHSGGENRSDGDRIGLNITYCLGWLRQEENQYLACPPEVARHLDPDLRALLGYAMGSYALGYFTPPLPPGEGPESVPPSWLFDGDRRAWGDTLYEAVSERAAKGAM